MINSKGYSSSEEEDQNLDGHFKKIDFNCSDFYSENNDSMLDDSESVVESRKGGKKLRRKRENPKQGSNQNKSKMITKNRESAKLSRLRKKEYQERLEQTVVELQADIEHKKANIRHTNDLILKKLEQTNQEKHNYLVRKLHLSKQMLAIEEEVRNIKQTETPKLEKHNSELPSDQIKIEESQQPASPQEVAKSDPKEERTKVTKGKKKKTELDPEAQKAKLQGLLAEKDTLLKMTISTYLYQFGVRGCMRSDIIERCKAQYLQAITQISPNLSPETLEGLHGMKSCLQRIESKTKALDYHMRQLNERVKDKYVVQFILDRQFFANDTTDTIYKNSQLKGNNSN